MYYSKTTRGFYTPDIHGESIPSDAVEVTLERHAELMDGQAAGLRIVSDASGAPVLAPPQSLTTEQVQAAFTAAIQQRLDAFAQTRGYDGILSACTYATSTIAKFAAEGQCAVDLRDLTWEAAYQVLAEVQAGTRAMPATLDDIAADLPALEWPA